MSALDSAWTGSAIISGAGVLIFGGYLLARLLIRRKPVSNEAQPRPWRTLGAVLCLLLSILFFVGVNYLDGRHNPRIFLAFWVVLLLLTGWVIVLALIDIWYTRRFFSTKSESRRSE